MKNLIKSSLLVLILMFNIHTANANNGFLEIFNKLCVENKIDFDGLRIFFTETGINLNKAVDPQLYINIFKWMYTPYRYGGKTEKGIDCSNYVFKLNSECQSDYSTSNQLAQITTYIDPEELQEGDLVFFNVNGGGISHVGIYLQNGKFTHSSSSKGVVISSLDEPYWAKRFCRAGRIASTYKVNN